MLLNFVGKLILSTFIKYNKQVRRTFKMINMIDNFKNMLNVLKQMI